MKFTMLIPTTYNDGTPVKPDVLDRIVDSLWRPFRGMTREGNVTGHWIDDDGTEFTDVCLKVFIECDRSRLFEAIKAVKRVGRRLGQRAMFFEVSGYDGEQILRSSERRRKVPYPRRLHDCAETTQGRRQHYRQSPASTGVCPAAGHYGG